MSAAGAMLLGLALELAFGWPDRLHRRIGHPVAWIGGLIGRADAAWNRPALSAGARRALGVLLVVVVVGGTALAAGAVQIALPDGPAGLLLAGLLAWPAIAARSLHEHVARVAAPLSRGDVAAARRAVAMIVGRDPARLDRTGIARAALESLAENASDGVVAPLFWGALLGLPGLWGYKAVNTLDSMVGYRTKRHEAFGWAAARLDDLANLAPARLTALLVALVSGRPRAALDCMRRDAGRHRSPNAGWPEAAMAGALGVRLSGPRIYATGPSDEPFVNAGAPDPDAGAILRGLAIYRRLLGLLLLASAAIWLSGM